MYCRQNYYTLLEKESITDYKLLEKRGIIYYKQYYLLYILLEEGSIVDCRQY